MIGDVCQSFGKQFAAKGAKYENNVFSLDLAGAYECDGLEAINRSFKFDGDKVTLTDVISYNGDKQSTERLVTRYEPNVSEAGNIKVDCGGVIYDPSVCDGAVSSEPLSKGGQVYFIDFILNEGVKELTVTLY